MYRLQYEFIYLCMKRRAGLSTLWQNQKNIVTNIICNHMVIMLIKLLSGFDHNRIKIIPLRSLS